MDFSQDWTPFDLGEVDTLGLDFVRYFTLDPTEVIVSVAVVLEVAAESPAKDDAPASRLTGAASFSGTVCSQKVTAPSDPKLAGCRYRLQFKPTTNRGNTPSGYAHFFVNSPA